MVKLNKNICFKSLLFAGLSLTLTNCGFGGKGADPLQGQDSNSFVTESQRRQNEQDWQQRFDQETRAYEESIAALEHDNETRISALTAEYSAIENRLRSQQATNEQQWQSERDQFAAELTAFRAEQEQVIAGLRSTVDAWENRTNRCEEQLQNPEPLSFQGLLYQFELQGSAPESFEWNVQEEREHHILFQLNVAGNSVQGLEINPALPQGLEIVRGSNSHTWIITGAPQVEVPLGQTHVSSRHTIKPIIDEVSITNERERLLVGQQSVEKDFLIVINQIRQRPSVEVSQEGANLFIHVVDPADIEGDQAPSVSFNLQNESGTVANQIVNAASFITAAQIDENPRRGNSGWTYVFKIHSNLAPTNWQSLTAQITVNSQSTVSGLASVPVTRGISIEESQ